MEAISASLCANRELDEIMSEFLLNTGSTIEEGRLAKGGNKMSEDYTRECAVCDINPQDYLADQQGNTSAPWNSNCDRLAGRLVLHQELA